MSNDGAGSDHFYHPAEKWLTSAIALAFIKSIVLAIMYFDGAKPSDVERLGLVGFAILLWLTILVGRRNKWARSALLLLAAVYIPIGIESSLKFQYMAYRLATFAESIALVGCLWILFGRRCNEWFSNSISPVTPYSHQVIDASERHPVAEAEDTVPSDAADSSPQVVTEVEIENKENYRGWRIWQWAIVFWIMVFIFSAQGTKTRNVNEQGFLYGVIVLQSIIGSVAVRVVSGAFHTRYSWHIIFRIAIVAVMAFLLLCLTMCSGLVRHGWG